MSALPLPATDSVPGAPMTARGRSWAQPGLAVLAGALALSLAACGGGTTTAAPAAAAPTSGAARGGGQGGAPGVFGLAAAVTSTNVEVQSQQSGQTTVNFSSTTTFTNDVTAALTDVTVGSCVTVIGSSAGAGQPITARTVTIRQPGANGCVRPGGGQGGAGASRRPNPSRQPRPSGANGAGRGNFGGAFGAVSAVSATGFTVHSTNFRTNAATDANVTVSSSTTYVKTVPATSGALTVGMCVAATGPADDTGAVTAKTITVSKPTNGACTNGFGGGRRGGGNRGGAAGGFGGGNG